MELAHLVHVLKAGGGPALIGLVIAVVLGWPKEDAAQSGGLALATYHSTLIGHGHELNEAVERMLGYGVLFAAIGFVVGYALIQLGVVTKDELGIDE